MTEKAIGILLLIASAWWLRRSLRLLLIERHARRATR